MYQVRVRYLNEEEGEHIMAFLDDHELAIQTYAKQGERVGYGVKQVWLYKDGEVLATTHM